MKAQLREEGDRYPTVVVERDGQIIAWAGFGGYRSRPCYAGIGEHSVYVAREARGAGAGLAALQALFMAAEERGYWKLLSRIFTENIASLALHKQAGFREVESALGMADSTTSGATASSLRCRWVRQVTTDRVSRLQRTASVAHEPQVFARRQPTAALRERSIEIYAGALCGRPPRSCSPPVLRHARRDA